MCFQWSIFIFQHPVLQLELVEGLQRWRWKAEERKRGEGERGETERKKGLGRESKDRQMERQRK